MLRYVLAGLLASALATTGCSNSKGVTPPSPSASTGSPSASPPAASTANLASAPFELVHLFDLGHDSVCRFAYEPSSDQLLVAFDKGEVLYQFSVAEGRLVHSYPMEPGFMVDDLWPSPDGRLLVAGVYRVVDGASQGWEKYGLFDLVGHKLLSQDLGLYDRRFVRVDFGTSGKLFRLTASDPMTHSEQVRVYDASGQPKTAPEGEFVTKAKGRLWVLESTPTTASTHGLYLTDEQGHDQLLIQGHWHDNYGLTKDGRFVVTSTWDGEVLVFSTETKKEVYRQKIAQAYGYLAYDGKRDRFLIADATRGTSYLRALVRKGR